MRGFVGVGAMGMRMIALATAALMGATAAAADLPIEEEPIRYLSATAHDPVARLQGRIDGGEVTLKHERDRGYLKDVLKALDISPTSQALVFSKTSFQHTKITPKTPRALYFNDDVYVGWVQHGDVLEVASIDPALGTVFYLLDQAPAEKPSFGRETHTCLQCHQSSKTQEVPGVIVRSVFPNRAGTPVFSAGAFVTSHESPLKERWGGWYVTGTHGAERHMGNVVLAGENPDNLDREAGANVTDLSKRIDTTPYLTPHSDIVALMVLEHQTQAHNALIRADYEARIALRQESEINKALGRPKGAISESTRHRIESYAEKVVRAFLFVDEAKLSGPVVGTSGYAEQFARRGPRDPKGRSLRDFDFKSRMFRYPCSYLIYSKAFDALPYESKEYIFRRLRDILTGRDTSSPFAHLSTEDRSAILEILRATKPGFDENGAVATR
jgi:hypothetical protein